jgi:hypothetical protein
MASPQPSTATRRARTSASSACRCPSSAWTGRVMVAARSITSALWWRSAVTSAGVWSTAGSFGPPRPLLHAALGGKRPGLLEPDRREVHAGHQPAALGEPDRVASLAAGDVERAAWSQPLRLLDEEPAGVACPEQLAAGVAPVPCRAVHHAVQRHREPVRRRVSCVELGPGGDLTIKISTSQIRADQPYSTPISSPAGSSPAPGAGGAPPRRPDRRARTRSGR